MKEVYLMKKWIDANLITEYAEVQKDKWKYEDLMKQKPNFDKGKEKVKRRNKKKFKYRKQKEGALSEAYRKTKSIL